VIRRAEQDKEVRKITHTVHAADMQTEKRKEEPRGWRGECEQVW